MPRGTIRMANSVPYGRTEGAGDFLAREETSSWVSSDIWACIIWRKKNHSEERAAQTGMRWPELCPPKSTTLCKEDWPANGVPCKAQPRQGCHPGGERLLSVPRPLLTITTWDSICLGSFMCVSAIVACILDYTIYDIDINDIYLEHIFNIM